MSYETSEGKKIKIIEIEISELILLFNKYSKQLPYELLSVLDNLEYDLVNIGTVKE